MLRNILTLPGQAAARLTPKLYVKILRAISKRSWLVGIYYIFTGQYSREQKATFNGRLRHLFGDSEGSIDEAVYDLRRSVHRLEKGLIMRPRRKIFAENYIETTVDKLAVIIRNGKGNRLLEQWATDVLNQFFSHSGPSPAIDRAKVKFSRITSHNDQHFGTSAPYKRNLNNLNINIDNLLELAVRRRSVRWYLPNKVPRSSIDKALEVARLSPSACNRQPFEFRIFDDPELVKQVSKLPMGTRGFEHNLPCIAVVIGQLRAFPYERDRHVIYIDAALATMAFEFALEAQGLSSCSINWPDIPKREEDLQSLLGLAQDERPIMLISLGYPDPEGMVPFSEKKTLEELRSYNRVAKSNVPRDSS